MAKRLLGATGPAVLIVMGVGTGLSASPVLAQSVPRAEDPVSVAVDEIVVTARKREENLQEVPLSIAAFSSAQLQALGIRSDYDLAHLTIGYRTLQQTGRDIDRPTIRGMAATASRGEPNASYFIDGVFVSGSISTAVTSAVDRVEVLRGPQSAQFGRATFSGAINYVTKTPGEEFAGQINSRAGTNDDYDVGGWASGPLIDGALYFLVSGDWSKYGGQWHNNLAENQAAYQVIQPFRNFLLDPPQEADHSRLGAEETSDFVGKLVWRPAEGSEISVKYDYTHSDDTHFPSLIAADLNCYLPPADYVPPINPAAPLGPGEQPWYRTTQGYYCGEWNAEGKENRINLPDFRDGVTWVLAPTYPNPQDFTIPPSEPGTFRDQNRVLLDYTQDLGGYTLTARAAYNNDNFKQLMDLDHTETRALWGLFHFDIRREIEDYSGELRLSSPADLPIRGSVGAYYYDQHRQNTQRSYVGPGVVFGDGSDVPVTTAFPPSTFLDVTNKAVFGSIDVDLAEQWTLGVEARYAWDSKDGSGGALGTCDALNPALCAPNQVQLDFNNFTPRVTLRYEPSDKLMLYVLAAKGNKPGDFNTEFFRSGIAPAAVLAGLNGCVPADPAPVKPCLPEPLALVKEEEQWTYEVGAKATWLDGRLVTNAAAYYIDWSNQGLFTTINILQTSGSYLTTTVIRNAGKSEVKGLELETTFRVTDNLSLVANYGYTNSKYVEGDDPATFATTGDGDISGNRVPGVPEHTVILGAYATAALTPELTVFIRPDYVFNSKRYTSPSNLAWIGNDVTLNFRMGIQADRWTLTGYVRNVLDDQTPVAALDFVNFGAVDVNYPVQRDGKLVNNLYPLLFSLNPKRGRDAGVELQYRF